MVWCVVDCISAHFGETMLFSDFEGGTGSGFISSGQVEVSLRGKDQVFVLCASLVLKGGVMSNGVAVMCKSECISEINCNLSLEQDDRLI